MEGSKQEPEEERRDEERIAVDEEWADTLRQLAEVEAGLRHGRATAEQERVLARVYADEAEYLRRRAGRRR